MPKDLSNIVSIEAVTQEPSDGFCNIIQPVSGSDCIALTLRPAAGKANDIFRAENSDGSEVYCGIGSEGLIYAQKGIASNFVSIVATDSAAPGLIVKSHPSQSEEVFQVLLSDNTPLLQVLPNGMMQVYGHLFQSLSDPSSLQTISIPNSSGMMMLEDSGATAASGFYGATTDSGVAKIRTLTTSDLPAIAHSSLTGLTTGDPHTQYILKDVSSSTRNVITSDEYDGISLTVRCAPTGDTEGKAIVVTDSGLADTYFVVGQSQDLNGYCLVSSDLHLTQSGRIIFGSTPTVINSTDGYIAMRKIGAGAGAAGNLTADSNAGNSAGSINISAGASANGGSITMNNGGGSLNTTGSGSLELGVSATRTTLLGSGSAVSVTLPAVTGTLASLAGTQTFSGAKTFSSNITLQNGEYISNATNNRIDLFSGNGTNLTRLRIDSASWGTNGPVILATVGATGTEATSNIRFDSPIVVNNDVNFSFGGSQQHRIRFTTTGNDTLQVGVTPNASNSASFALIHASHLGSANRSPTTLHADPTFYVYSTDSGQANDFVRINHNQTDGVIEAGNGDLQLVAQNAINLNAGQKIKRRAITASTTATLNDYLLAITSISSNITITLPAASTATGQVYVIKDESGNAGSPNTVTIDASGAELIDGFATADMSFGYGSLRMYCNGTAWFTF